MNGTQRHQTHTHLIKAGDDLVQQSEAVHTFMFDLLLFKVFIEASNGSKHDTDLIIGLGVKLLKHLIMAGKNNALYWTLFYKVKVPFEKGQQSFRFTSSFLLRSRKWRATCTGRMLYSRHSLCSRNSRMSSTSCWACRRHRKSSLAVASHLEAAKACLNTCSVAPKSLKEAANQTHLPPVIEDSNNKHGNEKDGNSYSSDVLRSVGALTWREGEWTDERTAFKCSSCVQETSLSF